jgi:hypothetical protein
LKIFFISFLVFLFEFPLKVHAGSTKKLKGFLSFCGVQYGDKEADVRKKLGAPSRVENSGADKYLYYFVTDSDDYGGLKITLDRFRTGKVTALYLYTPEAAEKIESLGIKDPKMGLLGKRKKVIIGFLGKPDIEDSGYLDYDSDEDDGPGFHVTFYVSTYSFDDYACDEIDLNWTYPPAPEN